MSEPTHRELLDVAIEAAHAAGRRALGWFGALPGVETKADGSPVTIADRESEATLREHVHRAFPGHSILGEEGGLTQGSEPYRWILDPIDGTRSFVAGVPLWSVLVAVEVRTEPVVGVILLPALGEMVAAALGEGCTWNGRAARVSATSSLKDALLLASSARAMRKDCPGYGALASAVRTERTWGDGYGYALVATGRADVMMDAGVAAWDLAPMIPILEEAGGRFTDWLGRRNARSRTGVATNGLLHDEVLRVLAGGEVSPPAPP
jgi:histidinol-phosphatase